MNKPLVIYHDNCADGFGAAFAAWLKLGDEAEYVAQQYGSTQEELPVVADRDVYILDFSYPKPWMDLIFSTAKRVVWCDHHKTAFEMWRGSYEKGDRYELSGGKIAGSQFVVLDDNKSGAMLAWEYFHPESEVPLFIKHVDDHDRWQFKLSGTKPFIKALWSYAPWTFANWEDILRLEQASTNGFMDMYIEGAAILRAHGQNVHSVTKGSARKCSAWVEFGMDGNLTPIKGLAANCPPHLTSDVGHELATASGTFGLCWCLKKEGMVAQCSLRSNGDYDVSAIAKAFGGGGHASASGFEVPVETLLSWLK